MPELSFTCPEDIQSMPATTCGYFCSGCNKNVVDFRNFSPEKIQDYLRSTDGPTCGLFRSDQLKSPVRSVVSTLFRIAFTAVFLFGIGLSNLAAQEMQDSTTAQLSQNGLIRLSGKVTDDLYQTLPFTKIVVTCDSATYYSVTDPDGNYCVDLPGSLTGQTISISARFVGYQEQRVVNITLKAGETVIDFTLAGMEMMLLGGVIEYYHPIIPRDPYDFGKTSVQGEDLEHRQR
jgi:hypothetical protein